jgi:hypothetical protein
LVVDNHLVEGLTAGKEELSDVLKPYFEFGPKTRNMEEMVLYSSDVI